MFNPDTRRRSPVLFLATGRGLRLRPLTSNRSKRPSARIGEIEHAIESLARDGNGGLMVLPDNKYHQLIAS